MTEEPQLAMPLEALGAVGAKPLRMFQLVRIGRHTSSIIPVSHADVTLLTGTGPEGGSNGAGKSMMASAIALANADADWLRGGIGHHARNLLFNQNAAETKQLVDAPSGYIASVYWKEGDPRTSAVTVWMRIQRTEPFVQVKFAPGIRLALGATELECATHATEVWNDLPGPALTSGKYAEKLFGNGTRCLAYLRKRGEKNIDDGILSSAGKPHRPDALADMLINLAGKNRLLADEQKARKGIYEHKLGLEADRQAAQEQYERDEITLKAISRMLQARAALIDAETDWNLYLAARIVEQQRVSASAAGAAEEAKTQLEEIRQNIDVLQERLRACQDTESLRLLAVEAAQRLREAETTKRDVTLSLGRLQSEHQVLEGKIAALADKAARGDANALEQAQADLAEAHTAVELARDAVRDASAEEKRCRIAYEREAKGQGGKAGEIIAALDSAGLRAVPLVDAVRIGDLAERDRRRWEARLAVHAQTVIVRQEDLPEAEQALRAARLLPGCVLFPVKELSTEGAGFPPVEAFLSALETRTQDTDDADIVHDEALGLRMYGGFEVPITDRLARIAAARERMEGATEQREDAEGRARQANRDRDDADAWLACCQAALDVGELRLQLTELNGRIDRAEGEAKAAEGAEAKARTRSAEAETAYGSAEQNAQRVKSELAAAGREAAGKDEERKTQLAVVQACTESLALLARAFPAGIAAAEALVISQPQQPTPQTTLWQARKQISRGLELAGCSSTQWRHIGFRDHQDEVTSDTVAQIRVAVASTLAWLDEEPDPNEQPRSFQEVSEPATRWIDFYSGGGAEEQQAILARRERSQKALEASEANVADSIKWSEGNRETLIKNIEAVFTEAEERMNALLESAGQSRVRLNVRHRAATDPEDPLRWEVRPHWVKPGADPIPYHGGERNTAEYVIFHAFLAASTLASGGTSSGRMLIIDEAGNNLDSRNVGEVAKALRRIAREYGITVVLAVQSQDINSLRPHCATLINLSRYKDDVLNAEPQVMNDSDSDLLDVWDSIPMEDAR
ncbi:hypothetical protein E4N62_18985 [Streptomyces sp. MNU76]|uniref:hypothetical protein n=1 Tax=Streptomyces sp. MNU76 TaxID=2560026 RepID=UPI001E63499A|nr:hypothetical protein [Streptomyces sp. MNU76]MCC9707175.1 hypothetical protein [Streptomyces sp. MNU76]